MATRWPRSASRWASDGPACPVPMMIASKLGMALPPLHLVRRALRRSSSELRCARGRWQRQAAAPGFLQGWRAGGLVQDNALEGIEAAFPGCRGDRGLRVAVTRLPAPGDTLTAEIDVLAVILMGEAWRQQPHDVHLRRAAEAGKLGDAGRRALRLGNKAHQFLDDMAQAMRLLLAGDVRGDPA